MDEALYNGILAALEAVHGGQTASEVRQSYLVFHNRLFDRASVPGRTCGFGFVSCRGGDRNKDTTIAQHAVHHGCSTLEINQFADSQLAVGVHCTDEDVFLKYASVSKVFASLLPPWLCVPAVPPPREFTNNTIRSSNR